MKHIIILENNNLILNYPVYNKRIYDNTNIDRRIKSMERQNIKRGDVGILIHKHKLGGSYIFSEILSKEISGKLILLSPNKLSQKQGNTLKINTLKIFNKRIICNLRDIIYIDKKVVLWHINYPSPIIIPIFFLSLKPKIITFHFMLSESPFQISGRGIFTLINRIVLRPCYSIYLNLLLLVSSKFVFITNVQLKEYRRVIIFKRIFNDKSHIVNNFIESNRIIKQKNEFLNRVLFIGRYTQKKGVEDLLKVARKMPDIKFDFMGSGDLKNKPQNARNLGEISNSSINEYYDQNSIFILPSYSETFGLVILEAMARGLVILASDLPTIREYFIDGRNGFFFPPGDVKKIKKLILYLKNNTQEMKKISKNNLKDVQKFTAENQVPKYIKIYREILNEK